MKTQFAANYRVQMENNMEAESHQHDKMDAAMDGERKKIQDSYDHQMAEMECNKERREGEQKGMLLGTIFGGLLVGTFIGKAIANAATEDSADQALEEKKLTGQADLDYDKVHDRRLSATDQLKEEGEEEKDLDKFRDEMKDTRDVNI